jgi:hypothetical protein
VSEIDLLLQQYDRLVRMPWTDRMSGAEKVWFVVYGPAQERRLRLRLQEFQIVTEKSGHAWVHVDLTDTFAVWMAGHRYRESYFKRPELLNEAAVAGFVDAAAMQVKAALAATDGDERAVVAVSGLGSLFGIVRASDVLGRVTQEIAGRLLVFFPGRYENKVYRLLDARDGWNYLAVPITAETQG